MTLPTFFSSLVTIAYVELIRFIDGQCRKPQLCNCSTQIGDSDCTIEVGQELGSVNPLLIDPCEDNNEIGQSASANPVSKGPDKLPTNKSIKYLTASSITVCTVANITMILLQFSALQKKYKWFYVYPYIWLWALVVYKFFTSMSVVHKLQFSQARFFKDDVPAWIEGLILWTGCVTIQLLSWHLVFILIGSVYNPLRAFLYCVVILSAMLSYTSFSHSHKGDSYLYI